MRPVQWICDCCRYRIPVTLTGREIKEARDLFVERWAHRLGMWLETIANPPMNRRGIAIGIA